MKRNIQRNCACIVASLALAQAQAQAGMAKPTCSASIHGVASRDGLSTIKSRWWQISLPNQRGFDFARASIGRRASADKGSRAAFRMLSRLVRLHPEEVGFEVTFTYISTSGREKKGNVIYIPRENLIKGAPNKWNSQFVGINRSLIHRVARRSGKLEDLPRYGAVDYEHPISVNLAIQPSLEVGGRVSMQRLAHLIDRPLQVECVLNWYVVRKDGYKFEVTVDYSPSYKIIDVLSLVSFESKETVRSTRYTNVSHHAILAVARNRGTHRDLCRYGAREPGGYNHGKIR